MCHEHPWADLVLQGWPLIPPPPPNVSQPRCRPGRYWNPTLSRNCSKFNVQSSKPIADPGRRMWQAHSAGMSQT